MRILVTGATSGLGAAITRMFVSNGHRVIAAGRRADLIGTWVRVSSIEPGLVGGSNSRQFGLAAIKPARTNFMKGQTR